MVPGYQAKSGGILPSPTIRVLVVDDYMPWRNFVSLVLAINPQARIVAEAQDGLTAIQKVIEFKPKVVVLDIGLPDMSGVAVAEEILKFAPSTRIIFLTENTSHDIVRAALTTGAHAYVVKSSAATDLPAAFDAVLVDAYFVSAAATGPGVRSAIKPARTDH
jgi:two-component system nitrate/nitrite response regulator NarL